MKPYYISLYLITSRVVHDRLDEADYYTKGAHDYIL